jgi:AraC family transcriptional regulator
MKMEVNIIAFEATKVAVLEHRGPPELLNDFVLRFIAWRKASQLSPVKTSKTFGIAYDYPKTTEPNAFRFDIWAVGETQPFAG